MKGCDCIMVCNESGGDDYSVFRCWVVVSSPSHRGDGMMIRVIPVQLHLHLGTR